MKFAIHERKLSAAFLVSEERQAAMAEAFATTMAKCLAFEIDSRAQICELVCEAVEPKNEQETGFLMFMIGNLLSQIEDKSPDNIADVLSTFGGHKEPVKN